MSLSGRVALVTGAAGGLGSVTAGALARHGARVLVLDLPASQGERVAAEIEAASGPGSARFVPADLADLDTIRALVTGLAAENGRIDILVNNAAI